MDQLRINIRVRHATLFVGILFTIGVASALWYLGQTAELVLSSIAAGAAITALVYTAINTQFTADVHAEQLRVKKLENAMTFIEYSTSPDMVKAVNTGVALREEVKGKSPTELRSLLKNSTEKTQALVMIFNYFERLGVLVRLGAADEQALRDYYHAAVKKVLAFVQAMDRRHEE